MTTLTLKCSSHGYLYCRTIRKKPKFDDVCVLFKHLYFCFRMLEMHSKRPRFQIFSRNSHLRCSQVSPLPEIFSFSTYSKAFATYLKSCWKPWKCNMFLARHQDDSSWNITTQHLPTKKTGSCSWPEYLSVCSCLRWKSLMKLITSINFFPVVFFCCCFLQICILFCLAV